jgi:hypothetical protein
MNMYLLFGEVFKYLLPKPVRGDKNVAWIFALLEPIQSLNLIYKDWVANIRYEMGFNGQVIHLERYLNDVFDAGRRIYIDDPANTALQSPYLYNLVEAQSTIFIYNKSENHTSPTLFNQSEFSATSFVVYIPVDLILFISSTRIYAILNKYRLAGKRYKIEYFL